MLVLRRSGVTAKVRGQGHGDQHDRTRSYKRDDLKNADSVVGSFIQRDQVGGVLTTNDTGKYFTKTESPKLSIKKMYAILSRQTAALNIVLN